MLSCDQTAELAVALCATAETLGQTLSANAAALMAQDLADYGMDDLANALQACRRELTGKLTLAAILQRIQAADGRPDPNEAWSIALAASDEAESVVLTEEIRQAMSASAPVMAERDKVGARMSFLSAYQRLVDAARRVGRPVVWSLSMGHDPQRRVAALEEAGRLGRLPAPELQQQIRRLAHEPMTQDGAAIAGLITGRAGTPSPKVRQKLQEVRAVVLANQRAADERKNADASARRNEFEQRRAEQLARLDELQEKRA
jgi:hypothetical protein